MGAAAVKHALRVAGALWTVTVLVAAVVAVLPGLDESARRWLGYHLAPVPGSLSLSLEIAVHNGRWVLGLGALSFVRSSFPRPRPLDALVYLNAGVNAGFVGLALGAYGVHGVPYLTHMPVESLAMAAALSGYRRSKARPFIFAALLVMLAAFWESYLTPQ
jgi:hypothetical protein